MKPKPLYREPKKEFRCRQILYALKQTPAGLTADSLMGRVDKTSFSSIMQALDTLAGRQLVTKSRSADDKRVVLWKLR